MKYIRRSMCRSKIVSVCLLEKEIFYREIIFHERESDIIPEELLDLHRLNDDDKKRKWY